jgi:class 3 adenylate cyclase
MESNGEPGQIVLSDATYHRVKDQLDCEHRGIIEGKNRGPLDTFVVRGEAARRASASS